MENINKEKDKINLLIVFPKTLKGIDFKILEIISKFKQ